MTSYNAKDLTHEARSAVKGLGRYLRWELCMEVGQEAFLRAWYLCRENERAAFVNIAI